MPQVVDVDRRFALMQLSDQFFPSGSFTLSHGLETLIQTRQIQSAEDIHAFLRSLLRHKIGTSDLVALVHAYRASAQEDLPEVYAVDFRLFAQTPIQEVREVQRKSGRAFLMGAAAIWQSSQLDALQAAIESGQMQGLHPVIFAVTGQVAGLSEEDVLFAFLHGFLAGLCGAGIRLGVLGHIKAQLILQAMAPELEALAHQAKSMSLEEMWSCTPFIDIAQMTHRRLPQKLFTN